MKIEDLKAKVDNFSNALENIEFNRETWAEKTKPLLQQTLKQIASEYPIGWHVQTLDWDKNLEGVNITFGPTNSGIKTRTETSVKAYTKHGGTIVFSQAYNGEVFVIILYPHVDEFVGQSEHKVLGRFAPTDITETFIVKQVSEFLDEMVKWENATPSANIGFKTHQQED